VTVAAAACSGAVDAAAVQHEADGQSPHLGRAGRVSAALTADRVLANRVVRGWASTSVRAPRKA